MAETATPASPDAARTRLRLVGTPQLCPADGIPHALERKDAALLAILALDGPTPRAQVAALLWPGGDETRARNSLRQRLFRLRRLAGGDVIVAAQVLQLAEGVCHDLGGLQERLEQDADAAAGDLLGHTDYGDLPDLAEWVALSREAWRQRRREARASLAEQLEGDRQLARALVHAERLVAESPDLEHAHRRVMRLHYLRGDRAAALAAYEQLRRHLQDELDARPGAETEALAALVERQALPKLPALLTVPVLRPPRLIGRGEAWALLQRLHADAGALVIEGEAGIGKTRLLGDFAAHLGSAARIDARPGDAAVPYALAARMVRVLAQRPGHAPLPDWASAELARIAPEFGAAPAGRLEPVRLQRAVAELIDGARRGGLTLLVVDDLHFADAATLELLPSWVEGEPPLAWFFGTRPAESPTPLAPALGQAHRLALRPLDRVAIAELLESLAIPGLDTAAWAAPLAQHTGGNPMYILETLLALLHRGPEALADAGAALPAPAGPAQLIERRLRQLSPAALKLARTAAIAGGDFNAVLAAGVLGQHPLDLADAWRELEAAQIIRGDAFAHDIIHEATRGSVPAVIARELHRAIAQHLQGQGAHAGRVARHWEAAEAWPQAAAAYDDAATQAAVASRRAEEVNLRERAAACHERAGQADGAFASRLTSMEAVLATQTQEQAEALASRLQEQARTDAQRVAALNQHANVLLMANRPAEAEALARRASEMARQQPAFAHVFDAASLLASALSQQGRSEEGLQILQPLQDRVISEGDLAMRMRYWGTVSFLLQHAARWPACAHALDQAIELAQASGDRANEMVMSSNLSSLQAQFGQADAARDSALRAQRLREGLGDNDSVPGGQVLLHVGTHAFLAHGQYAAALQALAAALDTFQRSGSVTWRAHGENHLANAWLQLGQTARARQTLTPVSGEALPAVRARRLTLQARAERALGRPGRALLQQARALLGPHGDPRTRWLVEIDYSREQGADEAAALCAEVAGQAARDEQAGLALKAQVWRVEALGRGGRPADAAAEGRALLTALVRLKPHDTYLPECWWILSQALRAAGDAAQADALLRQAAQWIRQQALPTVPAPFTDAFVHRQPVNRLVLAAAGLAARDGP